MNKKCFRVIFSKTQQCLVAVSEITKSDSKSSANSPKASVVSAIMSTLKPVAFSLFCALGLVTLSSAVSAQTLVIQADKSAPKYQQAAVSTVGQNVQLVNIQAPNAQGLSHNKYDTFNVDQPGAILNNSRYGANTQLAGKVAGNANLAKGEARVILNEVTSNNPSVLKGYVEVAGKKAEVIIANPNGLHCDGCGVINADRATLTTGKASVSKGHLDGFVVEKGKITISGKGMDNRQTDYTEILARSNEINADVWAKKELNVGGGEAAYKRTNGGKAVYITHKSSNSAVQPQVAIDVGQLGGMYAEKIHLVGTESGLGVRNAGHLGASVGEVRIDTKGNIVNSGAIVARGSVKLNAQQVDNTLAKISSETQHVVINSNGQMKNTKGAITADKAIVINTKGLANTQGLISSKGVVINSPNTAVNNTQGKIEGTYGVLVNGRLANFEGRVTSDKFVLLNSDAQVNNTKGVITAGKGVLINGKGLNNHQGLVSADVVVIKAGQAGLNNNQGTIKATKGAVVNTQGLTNYQGLVSAQTILVNSQGYDLDNSMGAVVATQDITLNGRVNNTLGKIASESTEIKLNSDTGVDNTKGTIKAAKGVEINSQGLTNYQGLVDGSSVTVNTQGNEIDNTFGTIVAPQDTNFNGSVTNFNGRIMTETAAIKEVK
ncbi:filamentous hemagglutinin N-terminal domain-containing protein [Glaesserella sp.]|uniref:two-partner secretion domain-containing protein n=1 Tax=Glaesserella sp. TaxID=2094731 RepID=UPI0035A03246